MSWTDLARNGRILVVDDAMENIQILHHALRDEHEVLFALDGELGVPDGFRYVPDCRGVKRTDEAGMLRRSGCHWFPSSTEK